MNVSCGRRYSGKMRQKWQLLTHMESVTERMPHITPSISTVTHDIDGIMLWGLFSVAVTGKQIQVNEGMDETKMVMQLVKIWNFVYLFGEGGARDEKVYLKIFSSFKLVILMINAFLLLTYTKIVFEHLDCKRFAFDSLMEEKWRKRTIQLVLDFRQHKI